MEAEDCASAIVVQPPSELVQSNKAAAIEVDLNMMILTFDEVSQR